MRLTAAALRTLKGKVVTFHDGCDDSAWNSPSIFFPGMKARITKVKDLSRPWWRFGKPASTLGFDVVFDYRDFLAWNRQVASAMDDETIWTAKEEVWLKSGKCVSYLRVGDDFFDVDE
jgi:hypothetical protein